MENQIRRFRTDQDNITMLKEKNVLQSLKRHGLNYGGNPRGVLGELTNDNIQSNRNIVVGKVAEATADYEKKAALINRAVIRSTYSHVQSKVDTGLASKNSINPSTRPPLRREESTALLAARAVAKTKAALKESKIKINAQDKENINIPVHIKKSAQEVKKVAKVQLKGSSKEVKNLKPALKEPTESLGKLKLVEGKKAVTDFNKNNEIDLPKDIEDIDAGDTNSPLLMSMYIRDIYNYLYELEDKYPVQEDHLKRQTVITGKMRATLIDWLVEVQRSFSLVLETFQLTVGIIDRYLQEVPNIQRNELQLVGVTAMFIASKYEEIYAPDVGDFVYVTDKAYTKAHIFQCERDIMSKLGFCLARPIPLSFLRRFVKAAHGTAKNHHLAKYLVDLCLVEYSMAHHRPSLLAAAAICLSLYLLSNSSKKLEEVWTPTLRHYSNYTLEDIEPVIRNITKIVINVENSKCKAVYNKYLDSTLGKVSSLPQLKSEAIHELAKLKTTP